MRLGGRAARAGARCPPQLLCARVAGETRDVTTSAARASTVEGEARRPRPRARRSPGGVGGAEPFSSLPRAARALLGRPVLDQKRKKR